MDYKEYMELAFELRNGWERERKAATAITDLLDRAEAAEAKSTAVMMVNKSLSEALKNAASRAEKAERERDEFKAKYIESVNRACELSKILDENGLEE